MSADFYERMLDYKRRHGTGWREIGSVIDKKEATIRLAFQRKSLSELEQKELLRHFFNEVPDEVRGMDVRQIVEFVVANQEEFLNDRLFREFVDKLAFRRIYEMELNRK